MGIKYFHFKASKMNSMIKWYCGKCGCEIEVGGYISISRHDGLFVCPFCFKRSMTSYILNDMKQTSISRFYNKGGTK